MADVKVTPKICCDNCGKTADKVLGSYSGQHEKPHEWGSLKIEGSRACDSYGGKERLDFTDLCPQCATTAIEVVASAMKILRGEN